METKEVRIDMTNEFIGKVERLSKEFGIDEAAVVLYSIELLDKVNTERKNGNNVMIPRRPLAPNCVLPTRTTTISLKY